MICNKKIYIKKMYFNLFNILHWVATVQVANVECLCSGGIYPGGICPKTVGDICVSFEHLFIQRLFVQSFSSNPIRLG